VRPRNRPPECTAAQPANDAISHSEWPSGDARRPHRTDTFGEGKLDADGKLTKTGYTEENNALSALKRRSSLDFSREFIWLPVR
jgi:hypothetical protein